MYIDIYVYTHIWNMHRGCIWIYIHNIYSYMYIKHHMNMFPYIFLTYFRNKKHLHFGRSTRSQGLLKPCRVLRVGEGGVTKVWDLVTH